MSAISARSRSAISGWLTGSATTPGTPRAGWSASRIQDCRAKRPPLPTTASASAHQSPPRPQPCGPTRTSYLWCGSQICQARNSTNAVTREYYPEGEFLPGSPAQPYYYGVDQIGSVRRAFASTTSAPAFSYDPYGNALQATAPVTDLNFVGMLYSTDSGLNLTQYR